MRVLIYGGRDWVNRDTTWDFLDDLDRKNYFPEDMVVVNGGARGADSLGASWAATSGYGVETYPADWDKHGKAAGHIRNQQMLDTGIDMAIEFPGGRGTDDMRRRLNKAKVRVITYEGEDNNYGKQKGNEGGSKERPEAQEQDGSGRFNCS